MKDDTQPVGEEAPEPFLERWSRRKAQARSGEDSSPTEAGSSDTERADETAERAPGGVTPVLPDLDSLDEGSDYSAFLGAGVDESLRRKALRKLFHSPKFNVCDGLDDYCDDFTKFEKLGDVITADMRYQLERAAERLERLADSAEAREPPGETAAAPPDGADAEGPDDDRNKPA